MRSHELAKILLDSPDVELLLQRDQEGNGYEQLRGIDFEVVVREDNQWDFEVLSTNYEAEDHCLNEEEWEELKETNGGRHAVLFP